MPSIVLRIYDIQSHEGEEEASTSQPAMDDKSKKKQEAPDNQLWISTC